MVFAEGKGNCTLSVCHAPNGQAPDLSGADPWTALANKNSISASTTATACFDMPYVTAGNPPGGVLMKRVTGEGCGSMTRMPSVGTYLTDDQLNCLIGWLESKQ